MSLEFVTGVAIPFESNGAAVLARLGTSLRTVAKEAKAATKDGIDPLNAAILITGRNADFAASKMGGLINAFRMTAATAGNAATAARASAAAFNAVAAAADRAAKAQGRYNASSQGRGGPGPGAGFAAGAAAGAAAGTGWNFAPRGGPLATAEGFAAGAYGPRGVAGLGGDRNPYASLAYQAALPGGARSSAIALTGGVDPAYASRNRAWMNRGLGSGAADAGARFGGLGIFGGMSMPTVPGAVLHAGIHAARMGAEVVGGAGIDAVMEAAKLQSILVSTQNVTGASSAQMEKARLAAYAAGDQSGMSVDQSAEMFRELSRQSQGSMSFDSMLEMLPRMAKMQTVLGNARGFSPHQTVDSTMALTHLFRQYDPKGQAAMFDTVLRMGELMPDNLQRAVTQMSYFEPTLKNLHVKDEEAAALMVAISRFGMGKGKGGTSIQNLFEDALGPLEMTKHAQAGKAALLGPGALNVLDAKGNSRFFTDKGGDPMGFLMQLADFSKKNGSINSQRVFESAFGKQGSRVADLMGDPVIIDQLKKIHDAIVNQKSLGLDSQANSLMGTTSFQMKRAGNDFQSLMTQIGSYALPGVTKAFKDTGDGLHNAFVWLNQHPDFGAAITHTSKVLVNDTEKFLAAHAADFAHMRDDFEWGVKKAPEFASDVRDIGAAFLAVEADLRGVIGFIDQVGKNPVIKFMGEHGLTPDALTGNPKKVLPLVQDFINHASQTRPANAPPSAYGVYGADALNPGVATPPTTRALGSGRRHPTRAVAHGGDTYHINIDARGAHPTETEKAVERAIGKHKRANDQMHTLRRSGEATTSPFLPTPLTVSSTAPR